jgi:hypothetical protein
MAVFVGISSLSPTASGSLTDVAEVVQLSTALRVYCRRNMLAMVEAHRALMRLAENPGG